MIAGVCLLLWAVDIVKKGMTHAFGRNLNKALEKGTSNRFYAFLSGMGVTTLLQSSNATALVISSFSGQGMIPLSMALAVMLGANVGTTLIAQFLSFDLSWLMPTFLILGALVGKIYGARFSKGKYISRVLFGVGVLFLSLEMIVSAPAELQNSVLLKTIFQPLEEDLLFALILATLLTWLFHSGLAFVLLTLSFVSAGLISVYLGLIMVIGANIGSSIAPLILTTKMGIPIFRVTFGNFLMKAVFGILVLILMQSPFLPFIMKYFDDAQAVINFHTVFNLILGGIFLPFVCWVEYIVKQIIPESKKRTKPGSPLYLDDKLLENPAAALSTAGRETLRLGDMVQEMLEDVIKAFEQDDKVLINKIKKEDDAIDRLYSAIKLYLVELSRDEFDEEEAFRFAQTFTFASNMEHIGDIIEKNLLQLARKKFEKKREFSQDGFEEIVEMHKVVVKNLKDASNLFVSNDVKAAKRLMKEKKKFREAELRTTKSHIDRLRKGLTNTLSTSSMHMDIVRDFKRINNHITATAYPILERDGEVKPLSVSLL